MVVPSRRTRVAAFAALLLATGCMPAPPPPPRTGPPPIVEVSEDPEWTKIADPEDVDRIARLPDAWNDALAEARAKGFKRAIDAEGALLQPDAALPRPDPTPGSYSCRVIKLGSQGKAAPFNSYKPFFCYVEVEGPLLTIVKQTGSQRPAGRLYPDSDDNRLVFLGTLALGTEEAPLGYG